MATTKKRLNISLPSDVEESIKILAKRDAVPRATKATQLLQAALAIEEDTVWDALASKRDTAKTVFVPHSKVWK